jgi:uncharacterized DUF497 family protein
MWDVQIVWDEDDDPKGNVQHIAEHDLTIDEVQSVLLNDRNPVTLSESSGRFMVFGETYTGRFIAVAYEEYDEEPRLLRPVTAFEVKPPARGKGGMSKRKKR